MVTKTYYAKLDCSSSATVNTADKLMSEYHRSFCDFMSFLTQSSVATLVAWNSGSNVVSGSFGERGYWDGNKMFGGGAHQVWKFASSSTRPFDWYFYTQVYSGSYAQNIKQAFNLPISGYGGSTDTFGGAGVGVLIQAAVCFSGSASFNPWNGTNNPDGQDTARDPRWVSGANNRTLTVLPRSNDTGGVFPMPQQKSNTVSLGSSLTSSTKARWHFIYDGDALIALLDANIVGQYSLSYIGPFELRNSLSGSGIANSRHGFVMYTEFGTNAIMPVQATSFGDIIGTTQAQNGGVFIPLTASLTSSYQNGSKIGISDTIGTFFATAYQTSSYTGKLDEFPIYVGANEFPYMGYMGTFNTGLIRWILSASSNDTTSDFSRAVFSGNSTLTGKKIIVPWTGSLAPGQNPTTRSGSNYTWTMNYGD